MAFVVKNDLDKFLQLVNDAKDVSGFKKDNIAIALAEKGKEIAEYEYSMSGYMPKISTEYLGNGKSRIRFEAKDIAYHEFGTGIYAQGSYPDSSKLPNQTLTFESPKGKQQTTQGWEYYYSNPDTKKTIGGKAGWFIGNGIFTTGNIAGAEIYYTAKALREDANKIAKKAYKGD